MGKSANKLQTKETKDGRMVISYCFSTWLVKYKNVFSACKSYVCVLGIHSNGDKFTFWHLVNKSNKTRVLR